MRTATLFSLVTSAAAHGSYMLQAAKCGRSLAVGESIMVRRPPPAHLLLVRARRIACWADVAAAC